VLFGKMASRRQAELGKRKDEKVAQLNLTAEQERIARKRIEERLKSADERIAEAYERAAQAEAKAAEANLIAEQERLTRVKLVKSLRPRRVATIRTNTNETLSLFPGTKAVIQFTAEVEPRDLASDIINLLQASDWSILGVEAVNPGQMPQQFTPPQFAFIVPGVQILTTHALYEEAPWDATSFRTARVLKYHLKTFDDLEATVQGTTMWPPNLSRDAILIKIGTARSDYFDELDRQKGKDIMAKLDPDFKKRSDEFDERYTRHDNAARAESEQREIQEVHKILEEQKRLRSGRGETPEPD
jgi:hypothetical protein